MNATQSLLDAAAPAIGGITTATTLVGASVNATLEPVVLPGTVPLVSNFSRTSLWGSYFEALAVLFLALGLLWLLLWLIKKRGVGTLLGHSLSSGMQIESRLAIGPKKWIIVVKHLDKLLVLGVTDHNISLLTEVPLAKSDTVEEPSKNGLVSCPAFSQQRNEEKKPE